MSEELEGKDGEERWGRREKKGRGERDWEGGGGRECWGEGRRGGDGKGERLIDQDLRGREEQGFYSLGTRELSGSSEQVMNLF